MGVYSLTVVANHEVLRCRLKKFSKLNIIKFFIIDINNTSDTARVNAVIVLSVKIYGSNPNKLIIVIKNKGVIKSFIINEYHDTYFQKSLMAIFVKSPLISVKIELYKQGSKTSIIFVNINKVTYDFFSSSLNIQDHFLLIQKNEHSYTDPC